MLSFDFIGAGGCSGSSGDHLPTPLNQQLLNIAATLKVHTTGIRSQKIMDTCV